MPLSLKKLGTSALLSLLIASPVASVEPFNCANIGNSSEEALANFQAYSNGENSPMDVECLHISVKRNFFDAAQWLIENEFTKDPQIAQRAEMTLRNAVTQIRKSQDTLVSQFELLKPQTIIPVISPAFRWAQSLNTIYLEVKFATRFDSPACLDLSDQEYSVSEDGMSINISAMCTNDKKLLHYKLNLKLHEKIMPIELDPESPEAIEKKQIIAEQEARDAEKKKEYERVNKLNDKELEDYWEKKNPGVPYPGKEQVQKNMSKLKKKKEDAEKEAKGSDASDEEKEEKKVQSASGSHDFPRKNSEFNMQSVGRLHVVLPKAGDIKKWPKLFAKDQEKPQNSAFWWDMHAKYEKELNSDASDVEPEESKEEQAAKTEMLKKKADKKRKKEEKKKSKKEAKDKAKMEQQQKEEAKEKMSSESYWEQGKTSKYNPYNWF